MASIRNISNNGFQTLAPQAENKLKSALFNNKLVKLVSSVPNRIYYSSNYHVLQKIRQTLQDEGVDVKGFTLLQIKQAVVAAHPEARILNQCTDFEIIKIFFEREDRSEGKYDKLCDYVKDFKHHIEFALNSVKTINNCLSDGAETLYTPKQIKQGFVAFFEDIIHNEKLAKAESNDAATCNYDAAWEIMKNLNPYRMVNNQDLRLQVPNLNLDDLTQNLSFENLIRVFLSNGGINGNNTKIPNLDEFCEKYKTELVGFMENRGKVCLPG